MVSQLTGLTSRAPQNLRFFACNLVDEIVPVCTKVIAGDFCPVAFQQAPSCGSVLICGSRCKSSHNWITHCESNMGGYVFIFVHWI